MSETEIFSDLLCDHALERGAGDGDSLREETFGKIKIERLAVRSEEYRKALNAEAGNYVSLHFGDICTLDPLGEDELISSLARELVGFYPHGAERLLVAGIGNAELVADSVGYRTVKELNDCGGRLCRFHTGVFEGTGIESADLIRAIAEEVGAGAVIAVDSVVTRSFERLSRTAQLSDSGLSPGRGLGAVKKRVDERSVARPVISIGVPTVIDVRSLPMANERGETLLGRERLFLTSHSVDVAVRRFAYVLSRAIEKSLV